MAIAEDAATVLEQFIHDGILLERPTDNMLISTSGKPSRRNHASLRGNAGQGSTDIGLARRDTTARQQLAKVHQAEWQPGAEP
jgi:hypothetical protein